MRVATRPATSVDWLRTQAGRAFTMPVRIAPLRPRHLDQVLEIERRVYPSGWTRTLYLSELAQPESREYLVAFGPLHLWRLRRMVLGYAGMALQAGEAHVTTVAVHPGYRRRGLGSRLLLALLRDARRRGGQAATLEVRASNRAAQLLYARFGFAPVGIRRGYYPDTGEDAMIMWAHGLDEPGFGARLDRLSAALVPAERIPWVALRPAGPAIRGA